MDLRQVYGDISKRIVTQKQPYLFPDDFDSAIAHLFAKSVQIEKALAVDEERAIRKALASFTAVVLECLEYWNSDWCLRTPKHKHGKFLTPSELTAPLRLDILEIVHYQDQQKDSDVWIATELLLKRCIEMSYILDFDLAMALFDYLRPPEAPSSPA